MSAIELAIPQLGEWDDICVSQFPEFGFSLRDVKRAGEIIARRVQWTPETEPEIRWAFKVANNWRDSHAYPMRSVRASMIQAIAGCELSGATSARLKRMPAIRRKLGREDFPMSLRQIQDLGGCRAIMASMWEVEALAEQLMASRHDISRQDNYIEKPKRDGYPRRSRARWLRGGHGDRADRAARRRSRRRTRGTGAPPHRIQCAAGHSCGPRALSGSGAWGCRRGRRRTHAPARWRSARRTSA